MLFRRLVLFSNLALHVLETAGAELHFGACQAQRLQVRITALLFGWVVVGAEEFAWSHHHRAFATNLTNSRHTGGN